MTEDLHIVWQAIVKTAYIMLPILVGTGLIGYLFARWLED